MAFDILRNGVSLLSPGTEQKQATHDLSCQRRLFKRRPATYTPDIPVFAVISACKAALAQSQEPFEVQLVLESYSQNIREQGWTVLITDCGKRGEPGKARQVFDAVPNKNVWHYSALVTALGSCGQWAEALELLEELKQLSATNCQLQPNHVTYSAAIVACARGGNVEKVQKLYHEMLSAGLEPDDVTYYIMLSTCSRLGAWEVVEAILQAMHEQGQAARISVYQTYIRHLCRSSQWNHACTILLAMQDLEVPPTFDIITEMLSTLNRCGRPYSAASLLRQAAEQGLIEGDYLCEATYDAVRRAGHADLAQTLRDYVSGLRNSCTKPAQQESKVEKQQEGLSNSIGSRPHTPVMQRPPHPQQYQTWSPPVQQQYQVLQRSASLQCQQQQYTPSRQPYSPATGHHWHPSTTGQPTGQVSPPWASPPGLQRAHSTPAYQNGHSRQFAQQPAPPPPVKQSPIVYPNGHSQPLPPRPRYPRGPSIVPSARRLLCRCGSLCSCACVASWTCSDVSSELAKSAPRSYASS